METVWLDCVEYRRALDLQLSYVDRRARGETQDTLLLLTHPHVYTFGRGGNPANLLMPEEALLREGIFVERVGRGGDVTYHGPGQLVGYPIIYLAHPDLHRFVRCLEAALIEALETFGVRSCRIEGMTGVWAGGKKIASIGLAIRRWISFHGFAFNWATNMAHFGLITPCGLQGVEMTSLKEILGESVSRSYVEERICRHFEVVFRINLNSLT